MRLLQSLRYLLNASIIFFWLVMMGLLASRELLPITISPLETISREIIPYKQNWGIYSKGEKIGCSSLKFREYSSEEGGYLMESDTELKMSIVQDKVPVSIKSYIQFNNEMNLRNFKMEMLLGDIEMNIDGEASGNTLILINDSKNRLTLPWSCDNNIASNGLLPWFYKPNLKTGDKFQWKVFNPLSQRNELVKAEAERSTFIYQKGDFVNVSVVILKYQNLKIEFWVDKDGNLLKAYTPWGWELLAE